MKKKESIVFLLMGSICTNILPHIKQSLLCYWGSEMPRGTKWMIS